MNPSTETLEFFRLDDLGSRRIVWNSSGNKKDTFTYSAWGEAAHDDGSDAYLASFTGKEYDDSGLVYFNARYYDPTLGRFLTEDPSRKGHSWYSYCNNNPLTYTDPTRRQYESPAFAELTGNQPAAVPLGRQLNWRDYARPTVQPLVSLPAYERFLGLWGTRFAGFERPLHGDYQLSDLFSATRGRPKPHEGIDLLGPLGIQVFPAKQGTIALTGGGPTEKGGYWVIVKHEESVYTAYLHLQAPSPKRVGEVVKTKDPIGYLGATHDRPTVPHLHFEIRIGGIGGPVENPMGYIDF